VLPAALVKRWRFDTTKQVGDSALAARRVLKCKHGLKLKVFPVKWRNVIALM